MEIINDGQWINGLDSISYHIGQGTYQWGQNIVNRGGLVSTRQGLAEVAAIADEEPRGMGLITIAGVTWLLAAIGRQVYRLNLNSPGALIAINDLSFPTVASKRMVHFEVCVQAQETIGTPPNTTVRSISPKFIMVMQDGVSAPQYWDGVHAGPIHALYPDTHTTPVGTFMKWVGDRLWVANGRQLYASDLLNPFQFEEQEITASGGFFFLPDTVTGMGITHDYKSLLVFTGFTTSAFQVGLETRTAWPETQDFQRVIFPSIGCASHRTVINQYGMTWWMSHDGLVGLDNALAAYQSSRLDIQDQNMIRSKEGISWGDGGGCAGSFGNFLLFSVPSGNRWNTHTWVMDQAVINTLAGVAPPAWCSNWTGIRPEQWVTGKVGGRQRCFCLSRDLVNNTDSGHQATVWEAFIGQRMDVPKVSGVRKAKDIGCAVESRFYSLSASQYARLRWIEIDAAEIVGDVSLQVYYCGRRTSYKKIIDTHLTSTVSPSTEEIFNGDGIPVYVPQYRTIRSVTDIHEETDNDTEIQTPYLRNIDREFSVLVMWVGQMAISGIRIAVDPESDYMEGTQFPDEFLARRITAEGEGGIDCTLPEPNAPTGQLTSAFLAPTKPRWVEFPSYDSAVPNGVFFVAALSASPPPGPYPSSHYPIDVTLTSETQGIDIYYSRDNTHPHGPPHQHGTHYTPGTKPHMTLGQHLRARGERDGMQPSVELNGQYTQSQCLPPRFSPAAGNFTPDQFPVTVRLSTLTPEATIRYVVNTTLTPCVTQNSHAYDPAHPPMLAFNEYLHAKSFKQYYLDSEETVGRYHRIPRCDTPTCTPDGGPYDPADYNPTKTIAITSTTTGCQLRYTINDTDVANGTIIHDDHGAVEVHPDDVLRVIAQKAGSGDSLTKTATYTAVQLQVSDPVLSPQNATVYNQVNLVDVLITCGTANVTASYVIQNAGETPVNPTHSVGTQISTLPATVRVQPLGHKVMRVMCFRQDMADSGIIVGEYDHDNHN